MNLIKYQQRVINYDSYSANYGSGCTGSVDMAMISQKSSNSSYVAGASEVRYSIGAYKVSNASNMSGANETSGTSGMSGANETSGTSGIDLNKYKYIAETIKDVEDGKISIADAHVRIYHLGIKTDFSTKKTDKCLITTLKFYYHKNYSIVTKSYYAAIQRDETTDYNELQSKIKELKLKETETKGVYTNSKGEKFIWDDEALNMVSMQINKTTDEKNKEAIEAQINDLLSYWQNVEVNGVNNKKYLAKVRQNLEKDDKYTEDYIDMIFDYINSKPNLLKGSTDNIDKVIKSLTSNTNLGGNFLTKPTSLYKIDKIFDGNTYRDLDDTNAFLIFMVESMEFESEEERNIVFNRAIMTAFEQLGIEPDWSKDAMNWTNYHYSSPTVDISQLRNLDSNGDKSWLDEFYTILYNVSKTMFKNKGTQSPKTINVDALFGDKDVLSPQNISEMYEDMYFTSDSSVAKFRNIINQAFDKFGIDNYYDEVEMLKYIFQLINDKAGIKNTKPVTLSKETVQKLNDSDIFKIIEDIVKSNELLELYYFDVDDEIDNYSEGRDAGDCWMIGALYSLNQSEEGKQIIKDAVTVNEDGSVTITFKGVNKSYTITKDDLLFAKENSAGYSYGDNTMLAIAVATEKLRAELGLTYDINPLSGKPGTDLYSGTSDDMIYWLTGKREEIVLDIYSSYGSYYDSFDSQTQNYLDYLKRTNLFEWKMIYNKFNYQPVFQNKKEAFEAFLPGIISGEVILSLSSIDCKTGKDFTTVDGKTLRYGTGGHAFGVKNVNSETITIFDLYTPNEYTFYISDFLKQNCMNLSYTIIGDYDYCGKREEKNIDIQVPELHRDKTIYNDIEYYNNSINIDEILTSGYNKYPLQLDDRDLAAIFEYDIEDFKIVVNALIISNIINNAINKICNSLTNYTDYEALNNAFTKTCNHFEGIINNIVEQINKSTYEKFQKEVVEFENLNSEGSRNIFELLTQNIPELQLLNLRNITETFLSFLPD